MTAASNGTTVAKVDAGAAEMALISGDLAKLTIEQRLSYYKAVCESVGLNPLTQPFMYVTLNNKLVLYAKRDATDQLRKLHGVSVKLVEKRTTDDGVYMVTAQATDGTGRVDESTGAVSVGGLRGDLLANAYMKAETKAKRRVTLSLCGLGMLDETEVETIPDAQPHHEPDPPRQLPAPRQPVAAGTPVPLTLDDIRAKFRGMRIDGHLTLCKAVNRLDDVLPSVAAGYDRGTIWEWLNQEMGWSESADLGLVLPADIEAAAAKVGEYLTLLKPAA